MPHPLWARPRPHRRHPPAPAFYHSPHCHNVNLQTLNTILCPTLDSLCIWLWCLMPCLGDLMYGVSCDRDPDSECDIQTASWDGVWSLEPSHSITGWRQVYRAMFPVRQQSGPCHNNRDMSGQQEICHTDCLSCWEVGEVLTSVNAKITKLSSLGMVTGWQEYAEIMCDNVIIGAWSRWQSSRHKS